MIGLTIFFAVWMVFFAIFWWLWRGEAKALRRKLNETEVSYIEVSSQRTVSLLVWEIGKRCLIKLEKGRPLTFLPLNDKDPQWTLQEGQDGDINQPFNEIRDNIDRECPDERPVPRIEYKDILAGYDGCRVHFNQTHYSLPVDAMDALNALAKQAGATQDLPIYSPRDRWEKLGSCKSWTVWRFSSHG